jgi:hypothetical protein
MSVTIKRVRTGFVRIVLGGQIGAAHMPGFRHQLAELLGEQLTEVEIHLSSMPTDALGRGVLRSFADILWARGCRVLFTGASVAHLAHAWAAVSPVR